MKRILLVLTILAFLISIGTCVMAKPRVEITFWGEASVQFQNSIFTEGYKKLHPEVKINLEEIPSQNIREKVMIALATGNSPDVLGDYIGRLGNWANQGFLASLSGTLSVEDEKDFMSSVLNQFKIDGELFGYPMRYWVISYMVNKSILDKVGIGDIYPGTDFPLKDWMIIAKKVKELGYFATCFFANGRSGDYWMLTNFLIFGANLWENGNYKETTLNSGKGVMALEWMIDMVKGGYAPSGVAGITDGDYLNFMNTGRSVMQGRTPGTALATETLFDNGLLDYIPDFRVVGTPHASGILNPPLFIGPSGYVVFKEDDTEKLKTSIDFAKFVTSKENSKKVCEAYQQLSARYSVRLFEDQKCFLVAQKLISENGVGDLGLSSPHYLEVRDAQFPELQAAFMGKKTPQQALDDFAKKIRNIWKEK